MNIRFVSSEKKVSESIMILVAFLTGWIAQYYEAMDKHEYAVVAVLVGFLITSVRVKAETE